MHPTRIFRSPEDMLHYWGKYKEDTIVQANEWLRVQYVGKDGTRVAEPTKIPYTLEGFKRYCRLKVGEVGQYFKNQDGLYNDFIPICNAIKEEIRENQIIGGLLGFYNSSITQRLNGLTDKIEQELKTTIIDFKID